MSTPLNFELSEFAGVFSLEQEPTVFHRVDGSGNEVLLCASDLPYADDTQAPLGEILLAHGIPRSGNFEGVSVDSYLLPKDYLPLGAVLNDAVNSGSERAIDFATGVMREIGHTLNRIRKAGQGVPEALRYDQILIERDVMGFCIVPPLDMMPGDSKQKLVELGKSILTQLQDESGSEDRSRVVTKIFNGFWLGSED